MVRSISKQSGESVDRGVIPEEEKVGYGGKDLQKRKVLSLQWKSEGVMDDESGESMELMEEVPLKKLCGGITREISAGLTEGSRELIPETRGSILEGTIF